MKRALTPLFAAILLPHLAMAEPVYLRCSMTLPKKVEHFDVKLDEASGKITHTNEDGSAFNADGFFSPTEASYKHVDYDPVGKVTETEQYTINRVDLSLRSAHRMQIPELKADVRNTFQGHCELIEAPERKF